MTLNPQETEVINQLFPLNLNQNKVKPLMVGSDPTFNVLTGSLSSISDIFAGPKSTGIRKNYSHVFQIKRKIESLF